MEQNYTTVQACIQRARNQRSDALGQLIFTGWSQYRQQLIGLILRHALVSKPMRVQRLT
jgi:hypothetical protein